MYLMEPERDLLLGRIRDMFGPGSHLALDHRPGFFATPSLGRDSGEQANVERFAQLAAAAESDPSLTDPAAWLGAHGWRAAVHFPAELFEAYGRPLPPSLQATVPGAAQSWLATAELP